MFQRARVAILAGVMSIGLGLGDAYAQTWPTRPLRIVVGTAPGGNADTAARVIGAEMQKTLGQPIIVEQRLGGAGRIAADAVAKAAPDGHSILLITGGHVTTGAASKALPYDTVESFAWLSTMSEFPFTLVVRADSSHADLAAVLREARAKPGTVSYGSSGTGATLHLVGELLGRMAGVDLLHIPYKGEALAMNALLAGDTTFAVTTPTTSVAQIKAARIRAIAVSSSARWKGLPDVPAIAEAGVAGYDVRSWLGLATTAGTPRAVVERLVAAMHQALQVSEVRARLEAMGGEVRTSTAEETRQRVVAELAKWNKLFDDAKLPRE